MLTKQALITPLIMTVSLSVNTLLAMDYNNNQLSINNALHNGHSSFSYKCCQKSYKQWPCQERRDCAKPCIITCSTCLIGREVITIGRTLRDSDSCCQVHGFVWGSKDMWFPTDCSSSSTMLCSTIINGTTGITLGSILATLCIFAPWCTPTGCYLCAKKKNNITLTNGTDYEKNYGGF